MEFVDATTKKTIIALDKSIKFAEQYKKFVSDYVTQFTVNKKDKKCMAEHGFERYLKEKCIEQLFHTSIL
ncbi:MAG: hypothetical protein KAJ91_01645 [Candidatus Aenigmarchaeota archaeon]|nr:hypothetical protein [Candidatus Aenigmarchaeota archaeon]